MEKNIYDSELMESSAARDKEFEDNWNRMQQVKKDCRASTIFGVGTGIAMFALSLILLIYSAMSMFMLSMEQAAINTVLGEEKHIIFDFSGWACALGLSVVLILCTVAAARFHKIWANILIYVDLMLFLSVGVLSFMHVTDDMNIFWGIVMLLYGAVGLVINVHLTDSLRVNNKLKDKEGYPDFNLNMHYMSQSHYVKDRRMFDENHSKAKDYVKASDDDMPAVVIEKDVVKENGMDGIITFGDESVLLDEKTLRDKALSAEKAAQQPVYDMNEISGDGSGLPVDERYIDRSRKDVIKHNTL